MKKYVSLLALWVLAFNANGFSQRLIPNLLHHYRPSPTGLAIPESTAPSTGRLTSLVQADGTLPLSVNDVIRLMLENNLDIGVNRFSPLNARYLIETLYERFDPTLTLTTNISRNTSPSGSALDGAPSNSRLSGNYSATYSHVLEHGTSYQVRFQLNRNSTNSLFSSVNPSYSGSLQYSFSQPILRNFGRLNNTNQIRIARNNLSISESQFEIQVMDLVTHTQNFYWDLVFAREDIKVQEASLGLAEKTFTDNLKQVEIGTLAPIEVIQAESEVASRRESLVVANYNKVRIEDSLKKMVSPVPDPALVLLTLNPTEDIRNRGRDQLLPVDEAIRLALVNRPEMRQIDLQIQNNDIDLAYARNQLLPQLDLQASYTQSGLGGTRNIRGNVFGNPSGTVTRIPGGVGDAFGDIFGFDFTGYSVGISLRIPLSNRSAKANHARVTSQKRLNKSRLAATAQSIATEVRDAYNQVEMNRARIEAAQVAKELAERRLEAEQLKFSLGASAIRFVLQEQQNLTQAQTTEIRSLVDYAKAVVAFDRATGRTLERNNIQIEQQLRPALAKTETQRAVGR